MRQDKLVEWLQLVLLGCPAIVHPTTLQRQCYTLPHTTPSSQSTQPPWSVLAFMFTKSRLPHAFFIDTLLPHQMAHLAPTSEGSWHTPAGNAYLNTFLI
jgi:hypothetical protein